MAFWGAEIKPGEPHVVRSDDTSGRLCISQATLGDGGGTAKSVVLCSVGGRKSVYVCALTPKVLETCNLHLEFEEEDDVAFAVLGPSSVHLCGYYIGSGKIDDEYGSDYSSGEDLEFTDNEASDSLEDLHDDDESESEYSDDDGFGVPHSRRHKSGVVIEEIVEDGEKAQNNDIIDGSGKVLSVRRPRIDCMESEDEDGFPISPPRKKRGKIDSNTRGQIVDDITGKDNENDSLRDLLQENKLSSENSAKTRSTLKSDTRCGESDAMLAGQEGESEQTGEKLKDLAKRVKATKKKKKDKTKKGKSSPAEGKSKVNEGNAVEATECDVNLDSTSQAKEPAAKSEVISEQYASEEGSQLELRKRKKKKAKKSKEEDAKKNPTGVDTVVADDKKTTTKPCTFGNGLMVEELSMGQPNGKKASPGRKVLVNYIGKLKNGTIFDSNVGQRPFKFRLGVSEVIKGWDVGVNGMRVGDKRRLTIPPSMGYGDQAVGKIPKNSWLIFDVELVGVQ